MAGPMYQLSTPCNCHAALLSGSLNESDLVPRGASGVADFVLSCLDIRSMLSVISFCTRNLHQSWIGQLGSSVAKPASMWYLAHFTAGSAVLTL